MSSGEKDHGHARESKLWEHAILREVSDEGRHKSDRDFHLAKFINDGDAKTADKVACLERKVCEVESCLKTTILECTAKITDLLKEQKITELRDKIAAIPRGVDINIPVTL